MKKIAIAATALAAAACATPAAAAQCSVGLIAEMPVTMAGRSPVITATLNGTDLKFLVDSGAYWSVLTPSALAQLGLKAAPIAHAGGIGGAFAIGEVGVKELRMGGARAVNAQFAVIADGSQSIFGGQADGIIGQNILGSQDVEYDFANARVRLFRASDCSGEQLSYWSPDFAELPLLPIDARNPHLRAIVEVNGKDVIATFDTGATHSTLSLKGAAKAGITPTTAGVEAGPSAAGLGARFRRGWIVPLESIAIGDEEIQNTRVSMTDLGASDTEMLIGADFFLAHRVYYSTDRKRLFFTYNGGPVFRFEDDGPQEAAASLPPLDDPEALARRAAAAAARNDAAQAMADLTAAIDLAPNVAAYRYERSRLHLASNNTKAALDDLDAALAIDAGHLDALLLRAVVRFKSGDGDGGASDVARAEALDPDNSDTLRKVARVYGDAERFEQEIERLDRWLGRNDRSAGASAALNERCWARALLGRELDLALRDCDAAIRRGGRVSAFLDSRALVLFRMGRLDEAIRDYDAALASGPMDPWTLYMRGLTRIRHGDQAAGEADLAAARELDEDVEARAKRYGVVA